MKQERTLVALAGQPNCGKSTVFNALTGASQHVANYPGVTVEKMTGSYRRDGTKVEVVDLPGTYSLTSYSPEERVSRDFILHENPSVVVNVVDASNLKRHLYLTFQLLEMQVPLIIDLNMMDVAERRGIEIDTRELGRLLGAPVVPTTMKKGRGKEELLNEIARNTVSDRSSKAVQIDYGPMEPLLREIQDRLSATSKAPQDAFVTQTIKADANGVFTYAIPRAGWWGFAALMEGKKIDGKDSEVGGVIWVQARDMK